MKNTEKGAFLNPDQILKKIHRERQFKALMVTIVWPTTFAVSVGLFTHSVWAGLAAMAAAVIFQPERKI